VYLVNRGVATYHSAGGWRETHRCIFQGRKMRWVATNVYSRKTSEKPEKYVVYEFQVKGSGVVFTYGEGISTPRVRHKGRQPLIKCAKSQIPKQKFTNPCANAIEAFHRALGGRMFKHENLGNGGKVSCPIASECTIGLRPSLTTP